MHFKLNSALALVATASALQVTSPTKGTELDMAKSNEITWSHVESDPTSFDIELVNEHVNPPVAKTIATNVQTSAGSYTFNGIDVTTGEGYQINLISNEPQNTGILAQSPNFDVSNAAGSSSTLSSVSMTSSTSTSTASDATETSSFTTTSGSTRTTSAASSSASKTVAASSSTASSSSSARPSTGAASTLGMSAVGSVLGGLLALLL